MRSKKRIKYMGVTGKATEDNSTIQDRASEAVLHCAAILGLSQTPASGALDAPSLKTDASDELTAMEHKYTERRSFAVTVDLLEKLFAQANAAKIKIPLFAITFSQMMQGPKDWVLMPLAELEELRGKHGHTP